MRTQIRKLTTPPLFEDDEDKTRTARLLNTILWFLFGVGVVLGPLLVFFNDTTSGKILSLAICTVIALVSVGLLLLMHRGYVRLASTLISSLLLGMLAVNTLTFHGIRDTSTSGYLLVIVMAALLMGAQGALAFGLATTLVVLIAFWIERAYDNVPVIPFGESVASGDLVALFGIFGLMAVLVVFALRDITDALRRARRSERELAASLDELRANRDVLQAQTLKLEHQSTQLETAAEVARDITAARQLDELLNQAADLIHERFGFYHTSIFLVDEPGEYAVLRAAAAETGKLLLAQDLRMKVEEEGSIGYVTTTGNVHLRQDVGADETYFAHPLLPETRSEVILPLAMGQHIIGALCVQSREIEAFDENDVAVLQTMADQLAVAIENTRLLRDMERTVRELKAASGRYTRDSWREASRGRGRPLGYRYRRLGVEPAVEEHPPEARQAWREGQSVVMRQAGSGGDGEPADSAAAVPIKLRGETVGVLNLRSKDDTISSETVSLVEHVADRLALAIENARLLEQTQRRAVHERIIADITSRVRSSMDPTTILQTAVRELGAALDTDRAFAYLGRRTRQAEADAENTESRPSSAGDNGPTGEGDDENDS